MNSIQYILISSVGISLSYIFFLLIIRNERNFKYARFYILSSIFFSLIIPFLNIDILQFIKLHHLSEVKNAFSLNSNTINTMESAELTIQENPINWTIFLINTSILVTAIFLLRLLLQVAVLFYHYKNSEKHKYQGHTIICNTRYKSTFSIFNMIFIPQNQGLLDGFEIIIAHEKAHIKQWHTIDLIIIELLLAFMWFNPLIWMMRRSLHLIHEYQADEAALGSGIEKLKYQTLLVNYVTEEKFICLSSSFNNSLIKKRVIMMSKNKSNKKTILSTLGILPILILLFISMLLLKELVPEKLQANTMGNTFHFSKLRTNPIINSQLKNLAQTTKPIKTRKLVQKAPIKIGRKGFIAPKDTIKKTGATANNNKNNGIKEQSISNILQSHVAQLNPSLIDVTNKSYTQINNMQVYNQLKATNSLKNDILYFINGVQVSEMSARTYDPQKIQSISVTKGKVFGNKIHITTK